MRIKNFNEHITESLTDKMIGKNLEDVFTYDKYEKILRTFVDGETIDHPDMVKLTSELPGLIGCDISEIVYFVIKENIFTGDDEGNIFDGREYVKGLEYYTGSIKPKKVELEGTIIIDEVLTFEDKKIVIVHTKFASMYVFDKNILY